MTNLPIAVQVWKENHLLARAIQGEGGSRTLTVTFLGADGAPISLEGCAPRLYLTGTNPPVFTDGTVKDASGGTAEFLLPSGLTETHGVYACQFLLSGTNYPPLKADGLTLLVEASDLESAAEATEEFSALTVALGKADAAGKAAAQAAAEAKASAETASAAEAVTVGCKTQAVSSAEAAAADRGKADTAASAAASARDAAQTSAVAAAQNAEALAGVYTKAQADAAFLSQSARGTAGGVMALPSALPATGAVLKMAAVGTAAAAAENTDYVNGYYGTWTPALSAGSDTAPTYTTSELKARYYRIGRLVFIQATIRATITNAGTGYAYITGLPFTASNTDSHFCSLNMAECYSVLNATVPAQAQIDSNHNWIQLFSAGGGGAGKWAAASGGMSFAGCYLTN